ncbi:unnamed protein product [Penicillium egyptiacum]|uniref:FAD-binding PCMH-type domain-containing protein n=1 Tax=Penicillium egyptiacum TaxID=1303716 RepID=A0A9W4P0V1_9EURO|nr:unnamed protein product [Penicillium egyptiacum]
MKFHILIFFLVTLTYAYPHVSSLRPAAAVCHSPDADKAACTIVTEQWTNSTWRAAQPGAVQWETFEAWPERNESCYIENLPGIPCGQGRISLYSVLAQSAAHIQEAVRFASKRNLRLVVKNSGHDFLGRSATAESLQILTHHMKGTRLVDDFVPEGAPKDGGEGAAVTIEAGVSLRELHTAVGARNRAVVAGAANTVGAAGGYVQGGGHSFLGPWKGLASDNALEFTVVTADGNLVMANKYQNSDLYWALRGGGGGTFGVVVNVTLRTFDETPVIFTTFNVTTINGNPNYWEALTQFHAAVPGLNAANGAGYYYITPNFPLEGNLSASALTGYLVFPNQTDPAKAQELFNPLFSKLNILAGVRVEYTSVPFPSIRVFLENILLRDDKDATGTIRLLGSRLVSRNLLCSTQGASRLVSTLRSFEFYPGRTVFGHIVAGGAVAANGQTIDSAVHPAWRKTAVHMFIEREWNATATLAEQDAVRKNLTNVEVPLLRSVEGPQAMGAYLNEANAYETDFQASFWGENYPRLYKIKQKWDPTGLFIVRRGVGSEDWDEEGFCRCT